MRAADPRAVRAVVLNKHARISLAHTSRWRDLHWRPCCDRAQRVHDDAGAFCVCAYREVCPDHGITHVGTHD